MEMGLTPTPESARIFFLVPWSITSLTKKMNFSASGVPSRNSMPA